VSRHSCDFWLGKRSGKAIIEASRERLVLTTVVPRIEAEGLSMTRRLRRNEGRERFFPGNKSLPSLISPCAIAYATLSTTCYASHRAMILSAQDDFKIRIDTANKTFDNFVRGAKEKLEICLRDKP
jgi:hypothetical protein